MCSLPLRSREDQTNTPDLPANSPTAQMSTPTRRTRFVCISDTHNCTVKLPKGDVLIHAGDLTNQGSLSEVRIYFLLERRPRTPVLILIPRVRVTSHICKIPGARLYLYLP